MIALVDSAAMATARIAPSVLAADFAHLAREIESVAGEADLLHLDVMDGHFVDNIALGIPIVAAISRLTDIPLEAHLMTTNPGDYLAQFADAGVMRVIGHIEALPDPEPFFDAAKSEGMDSGIGLNPGTPAAAVTPFLGSCSVVLAMTVEPGRGGQAFIADVLPKVADLRKTIDSSGLATDIEVDGGITPETAVQARAAGADVFVAGTAVFGHDDRAGAIKALREAVT